MLSNCFIVLRYSSNTKMHEPEWFAIHSLGGRGLTLSLRHDALVCQKVDFVYSRQPKSRRTEMENIYYSIVSHNPNPDFLFLLGVSLTFSVSAVFHSLLDRPENLKY